MRAVCYDPDAHGGLRLADTADPVPGADEALVAIRAIALNVGEVTGLAERKQPGDVLGWDAAGVVVQPAADGSGPPAGARVSTFGWAGGWAEALERPVQTRGACGTSGRRLLKGNL